MWDVSGDIITAGWLVAWTDLGLRLVGRVLGSTVMVETGKFMLVDPSGREQRNYSSFVPRLTRGDDAILKVQHWLQTTGAREVTVTSMATQARELLEFTKRSVEQIACYEDPAAFRRVFQRCLR